MLERIFRVYVLSSGVQIIVFLLNCSPVNDMVCVVEAAAILISRTMERL